MELCTEPANALMKHMPECTVMTVEDIKNIITPSPCHNEVTAKPLWIVLCGLCIARYVNVSQLPACLVSLKSHLRRISDKDIFRHIQDVPYHFFRCCTVKYNADVINLYCQMFMCCYVALLLSFRCILCIVGTAIFPLFMHVFSYYDLYAQGGVTYSPFAERLTAFFPRYTSPSVSRLG